MNEGIFFSGGGDVITLYNLYNRGVTSVYKGGRSYVFFCGVLLVATGPPPVEIMNGPLLKNRILFPNLIARKQIFKNVGFILEREFV